MKKQLLSLGTTLLLLTGCSEATDEREPSDESEKVKTEQQESEELGTTVSAKQEAELKAQEAIRQKMYSKYLHRVNSVINYNGLLTIDEDHEEEKGLIYVQLIDFDGNGKEELYIIYKTFEEFSDGRPPVENFNEEIWSFKDGKEFMAFSNQFAVNPGWTDTSTRSLTMVDGKTYLLNVRVHSMGGTLNEPDWNQDFLGVDVLEFNGVEFQARDSAMKTELSHVETGEMRIIYELGRNSEELRQVPNGEFEDFLSVYLFDKKQDIIEDGVGFKFLSSSITENLQNNLDDTMKKIRENINSASKNNSINQLSINKKNNLTSFLYHFTNLEHFDITNYEDAHIVDFLMNGVFDGQIDRQKELKADTSIEPMVDEEFYFSYNPYPVEQVNAITNRLFGIEIEKKNYPSLFSDEPHMDIAKYKNGYFYILDPDRGGSTISYSSQIDTYYDLGNDLKYIEFTIYEFSPFEFDLEVDSGFLRKSKNLWTNNEKDMVHKGRRGYAILKEAKDDQEFMRLIKYSQNNSLLTDEEIEQFVINNY